NDVDLSDTHAVSFAEAATNTTTLGAFTLGTVSEGPTIEPGSVGWTYTLNNAAAQYLAAGQQVIETYTVSVDDGHGGTTTQDVVVTITGTNDVPVIGGVSTGAVQEDVGVVAGKLVAGGALTIADVDQGQSNFAAQASVA